MKVILAGASGLIGSNLLEQLLRMPEIEKILLVQRRRIEIENPKIEQLIVDFSKLNIHKLNENYDFAFCCLGTTIKKAGSQDEFMKVDLFAVNHFAEFVAKNNCLKLIVVSAMGADAKSLIFYNRIKGEMENEIQQHGLDSIVIVRPSLLLGDRQESRPGEKLAIQLSPFYSPFLRGPLAKYRPVEASQVAEKMIQLAVMHTPRLLIVENQEIHRKN